MREPEWASDERLTLSTSNLDLCKAFHRCQGEGVPGGPVLTAADAFTDPHLRARGFPRPNTGADSGHEYPAHPWHWSGHDMCWEAIPVTGYDNEYVCRKVAGMSEAEYQKLDAAGHLAPSYLSPDGTPL